MIKIGSVIREYCYGTYIESTVISNPVKNQSGKLEFISRTESGQEIEYTKHESSPVVVKE